MGTVAPSATDCGIVYESISAPKRRMVLRWNPLSMGVPVKPTRAAPGKRPGHTRPQRSVLGAVGLVHHDDDVLRRVQHVQFALGGRQRLLELLDGRHHRTAVPGGEQTPQVAGTRRLLRRGEAAALESVGDLPVELRAVGNDHDGRIAEARFAAQLLRQPQHRQRLAGALRMPHHAAPLLRLAARQETPQRRTHGPVLLVPWQLLHQPPSIRLVDHVVAQDIE